MDVSQVNELTFSDFLRSVILARKAAKLRKDTGDDRYWAPMDKNKMPFLQTAKKIGGMSFLLLVREPVLLALTVYMSVSIFARDIKSYVLMLSPSSYMVLFTSSSRHILSSSL